MIALFKKLMQLVLLQLMTDIHVASNYIQLLVDTLFRQGQVQTCAQKERFLFYQILDLLLNKYAEG